MVALLEDEVLAAGMETSVVPSEELPSWEELRELAEVREATAVIGVASRGTAIGMWIVDATTGEVSTRTVAVPAGDPEETARAAAVRSVELLRVGLRERDGVLPRAGEAAEAAPAPGVAEPERLWLGLGGGVVWAPGGLEPTGLLAVAFRCRVLEQLSLGLVATFPLTDAGIGSAEGSAEVRPWWAWVEARWMPLGDRGAVVPELGIGLGAVAVTMRGVAREPFVAAEDVVAAFAWHAVAGLEVRPLHGFAVRLDAWCGTTAPEIGVRFGERRVATWGLPLVGGALAFAVGW